MPMGGPPTIRDGVNVIFKLLGYSVTRLLGYSVTRVVAWVRTAPIRASHKYFPWFCCCCVYVQNILCIGCDAVNGEETVPMCVCVCI